MLKNLITLGDMLKKENEHDDFILQNCYILNTALWLSDYLKYIFEVIIQNNNDIHFNLNGVASIFQNNPNYELFAQ